MAQPIEDLTVNDVVHHNVAVVSSKTPSEMLVLDINGDACFAFRGPSARIWELLETPICIGDLVDRLVEEYAVETVDCRNEVLAHLNKLRLEGILAVVTPTVR
jgi:hypothetical protein